MYHNKARISPWLRSIKQHRKRAKKVHKLIDISAATAKLNNWQVICHANQEHIYDCVRVYFGSWQVILNGLWLEVLHEFLLVSFGSKQRLLNNSLFKTVILSPWNAHKKLVEQVGFQFRFRFLFDPNRSAWIEGKSNLGLLLSI